jgi:hypothetical protein
VVGYSVRHDWLRDNRDTAVRVLRAWLMGLISNPVDMGEAMDATVITEALKTWKRDQ